MGPLTLMMVDPSGAANARFVLINGADHVLRTCNEALVRVPYWLARLFSGAPDAVALVGSYALAVAVGSTFAIAVLQAGCGWRALIRHRREQVDGP